MSTLMEIMGLDVERVDVVDAPANRWPFIMRKRDGDGEPITARRSPAAEVAKRAATRRTDPFGRVTKAEPKTGSVFKGTLRPRRNPLAALVEAKLRKKKK